MRFMTRAINNCSRVISLIPIVHNIELLKVREQYGDVKSELLSENSIHSLSLLKSSRCTGLQAVTEVLMPCRSVKHYFSVR